jgi:hypothetical protein
MSQCHTAIARTTLALIILVLVPNTVTALECYSSPPRDQRYWSWRQIDGRRCWYPGRPGMSKSKLHWSRARVSTPTKQRTSGSAMSLPRWERDQEDVLLESTWPALPQDSFEERFVGTK